MTNSVTQFYCFPPYWDVAKSVHDFWLSTSDVPSFAALRMENQQLISWEWNLKNTYILPLWELSFIINIIHQIKSYISYAVNGLRDSTSIIKPHKQWQYMTSYYKERRNNVLVTYLCTTFIYYAYSFQFEMCYIFKWSTVGFEWSSVFSSGRSYIQTELNNTKLPPKSLK